jgi:triacylglycerol lipase
MTMALSDSDAVAYGLLALCAENMYAGAPNSLNPPPASQIAAAGWKVVGYLTAQDVLIPSKLDPDQRLGIDHSKRVFYGFVGQNIAEPTAFVAAIRGTEALIEWFIDADFWLIPHPRYLGAKVEQGFWGIYQTMSLADPLTGATTYQLAAEGVEDLVGTGSIVVAGHSLGSALATYFTEALARRLGASASACLFASPRTGDPAWAAIFDQTVSDYRLFNYILDIVPHVPTGDFYGALSKATVIQPRGAQAGIRLDLGCNHHVLSYSALLDYAQEQKAGPDPSSPPCILGPASSIRDTTEAWALIVTDCGIATEKVRLLLKGLHTANFV